MNQLQASPEEQDFIDWLDHPVTLKFMAFLARRKEDLKEQWASGAFTHVERYAAAIANAKAIGQCEEISRILELEHGQLANEEE
jgi:hypothetical protein